MKQFLNIIAGFILGLAPLLVATLFGFMIYASHPNLMGFIITGVLGILAIWLGLNIFKKVQIVGPFEFMTSVHVSPDLDNLEPEKNSETKRRNPAELAELIAYRKNLLKGGSFRIYGDWFGKPHDNWHEIESAHFDHETKVLTLNFKEGERLEVHQPQHILEASTFLKVIQASRVTLTFPYGDEDLSDARSYYLDYKKENKRIETETNVTWYKPHFDVSLGEPALMVYGRF